MLYDPRTDGDDHDSVMRRFLEWLIETPEHGGLLAIAHNGRHVCPSAPICFFSGFDFFFVLAVLLRMKYRPQMTNKGLRIVQLRVRPMHGGKAITFRDSYCFANFSLSRFQKVSFTHDA